MGPGGAGLVLLSSSQLARSVSLSIIGHIIFGGGGAPLELRREKPILAHCCLNIAHFAAKVDSQHFAGGAREIVVEANSVTGALPTIHS